MVGHRHGAYLTNEHVYGYKRDDGFWHRHAIVTGSLVMCGLVRLRRRRGQRSRLARHARRPMVARTGPTWAA